jgi:N utilization substance protein B
MDMTRTAARELAMRLTFALFENPRSPAALIDETVENEYYATLGEEDGLYGAPVGDDALDYLARLVTGVYEHGPELDGYIEKYAVGWEFQRISRTAAAVLRNAMFEALYMAEEVPVRAAMNEAVELAKKYETPETVSFVNGVLGSFTKGELLNE